MFNSDLGQRPVFLICIRWTQSPGNETPWKPDKKEATFYLKIFVVYVISFVSGLLYERQWSGNWENKKLCGNTTPKAQYRE